MVEYEPTIGLETHVQLRTRTKLFCGCASAFGAPPNTLVCPICAGLPGTLPALNRAAFEAAVRASLALRCEIAPETKFDRKNYFYPDLPKGYQISQYDAPLSRNGRLLLADGSVVHIRRAHLEEDAGKAIHDRGDRTLVDFNRCGIPLLEVVTEPDFHTAAQAVAYLVLLRRTMRYVGASECDMEKGSLRCDVNVSLAPSGAPPGTRVEVKNLNSFRMVGRAIEHETARQREVLARGGAVEQETRLWRDAQGVTAPMRSKEEAHDYRYFPEPDLPPFHAPAAWVERLRSELPELPAERRARFERAVGLPSEAAETLTAERGLADYFEALAGACGDARAAANWVAGEVCRELNERKIEIEEFPLGPPALARLLALVPDRVSVGAARAIFRRLVESPASDPAALAASMGLEQLSDVSAIEAACREALAAAPRAAEEFRAGKGKALDSLVGRVMGATKGRANPRLVQETLRRLLGSPA
ncbi:MAG TPA: Asp-tRNA(Asn)/Glu-tRNA(Gln) amidotransferase subunit GatB [Planctomycetota bacterium]|jgi:aspartyl-tRNA(Asn)/glutamyl-tRNA(Gln) amidotransferase subunit B|nr:Asp-tRNA(Asn)/Glu-tRNA(Gln) amidotransferase subunit GatB [Planctomycetota bacterium]